MMRNLIKIEEDGKTYLRFIEDNNTPICLRGKQKVWDWHKQVPDEYLDEVKKMFKEFDFKFPYSHHHIGYLYSQKYGFTIQFLYYESSEEHWKDKETPGQYDYDNFKFNEFFILNFFPKLEHEGEMKLIDYVNKQVVTWAISVGLFSGFNLEDGRFSIVTDPIPYTHSYDHFVMLKGRELYDGEVYDEVIIETY